jgi:hypothetical protein
MTIISHLHFHHGVFIGPEPTLLTHQFRSVEQAVGSVGPFGRNHCVDPVAMFPEVVRAKSNVSQRKAISLTIYGNVTGNTRTLCSFADFDQLDHLPVICDADCDLLLLLLHTVFGVLMEIMHSTRTPSISLCFSLHVLCPVRTS